MINKIKLTLTCALIAAGLLGAVSAQAKLSVVTTTTDLGYLVKYSGVFEPLCVAISTSFAGSGPIRRAARSSGPTTLTSRPKCCTRTRRRAIASA